MEHVNPNNFDVSKYNVNPQKLNLVKETTKDDDSVKGFSFKEFTNKFESKDGASGMHNTVAKTTHSQLEFAQKLLLKQLQCQTPDSSFDPNQMMESMMGMLTIAQNSELVEMQKESMELQKALFYTSLSAFQGETVEHSGNEFDYQSEDQEIIFNLPAKVEKAVLTIHDASNNCVKVVPLEKHVGRNSYTWDGTLDNDESADIIHAPKGIYTVYVTAIDVDNEQVDVNIRLKSHITDIAYDENELALPMSGSIPIYDIKRRSMIKKATERYQEVSNKPIQHHQGDSAVNNITPKINTGLTLSDMDDGIPFYGS